MAILRELLTNPGEPLPATAPTGVSLVKPSTPRGELEELLERYLAGALHLDERIDRQPAIGVLHSRHRALCHCFLMNVATFV